MSEFKSLKDHVYDYIAEKINDGSLTYDKKIDEQPICEELNISRTPVREALIQLDAEGLLENVPRRGFFLRRVDEKKARDLYRIIGRLDGLAGALAMDFITDKEITRMKDLISSMDKAIINKSLDLYYKLQIEFHNVYINLCQNEDLIRLLNQQRKYFIRQKYSEQNEAKEAMDINELLRKINDDHKVIVEIFERKDKNEIEKHIRDVHWNVDNAKFDSY
ncbi:GntR family transcriptional regulator [Peribacillus muralis]|uniref:GntR family transcriptional regulator n=1 Tax=Peribacillus muralis TaxID=264697 RepID=UPI001F4DCAF3|nr:GntR family transcriptional regulator [Peribacillus muralis]MCK1991045.1 GntR family transcriptional regulator [Peribacillus muralis]MCK2011599.1 GntR family transcriptional regulator [Peribacillus muralis]